MSIVSLSHDDLFEYYPHRFENSLIDSILVTKDDSKGISFGEFSLTVTEPDIYGRDIFVCQNSKQERVLLPILVPEILALASIACVDKMTDKYLAFFASITQFSHGGDLPINSVIRGRVERAAWKANFLRYKGVVYNAENVVISSADILASFIEKAQLEASGSAGEPKKMCNLPSFTIHRAMYELNRSKHPLMFLADEVLHYLPDTFETITRYTYPKDHLFVKGHFPGNPIMMGVMQWGMIEDAALFIAHSIGRRGVYQFECDADILKSDFTYAAEAKSCVVQIDCTESGIYSRIVSTKKIAFRDMVHPGETLYCYLKNVLFLS